MPTTKRAAHPKAPSRKRTTKPTKVAPRKGAAASTVKITKASGEVQELSNEAIKNGKGYDPKVPLEERTDAEKQATLKALAESEKDAKGKSTSEAVAEKAKAKAEKKATRGGSLMDKMTDVLRKADGPLTVKEILGALPKGAFSDAPTPPSTRAYVQLHAGLKRGVTVKVDKGTFDLKELNPNGSAKRPKPRAKKANGNNKK